MPVVAFDVIDLLIIAGVLLLLGLLVTTKYTFLTFAKLIDVSILGLRPLHFVTTIIDDTIVAACNAGINTLGHVLHDLWRGITWSITEMARGLMAAINGVHHALDYLWKTAIHNTLKAVLKPIHETVNAIKADFYDAKTGLSAEVIRLDARIDSVAGAAVETVGRDLIDVKTTIGSELHAALKAMEKVLGTHIGEAKTAAIAAADSYADLLNGVQGTINTTLQNIETATADDLRDLIHGLPLKDIASVIAAVPLVVEAVKILEAETGLGRAECRAKVKNICAADPRQWAKLLASIALIELEFSFHDLAMAAVHMVKIVEPEIKEMIQG